MTPFIREETMEEAWIWTELVPMFLGIGSVSSFMAAVVLLPG